MILRNGVWHYDFSIGGKRYRGTTGHSDKKKAQAVEEKLKVQYREGHSAEKIWEQTKKQLLSNKELDVNASDIWDAFETQATSRAKSDRKKVYYSYLNKFCKWIHEKYPEISKVSEITPLHAKTWFTGIRNNLGANSTKNDKLIAMKMIFSSLGQDYGVIEDPFADIKKLPNNATARSAFTPEELRLIGQKATGWMYSLCLTAISTGLREGDICRLKKSCIDLASGWITIPKTRKTGVNVEIPILSGLAEHLREVMAEDNDSEYVFPVLADKHINDPSSIGKAIKTFFAEIGIEETTQNVDGYIKKISKKDAHSFRHTFVYLAALNGIPLPIVQGIVGHVTPEMTKHYMNHAGRNEKTQYLSQLPEYFTVQNKDDEDLRQKLATLAHSLPIEDVKRLLDAVNLHHAIS